MGKHPHGGTRSCITADRIDLRTAGASCEGRTAPLAVGLLEGAIPFGTSAEAAKAPSPLDTAYPFTLDEAYLYGALQVPELLALGVQGIQVDHDGI